MTTEPAPKLSALSDVSFLVPAAPAGAGEAERHERQRRGLRNGCRTGVGGGEVDARGPALGAKDAGEIHGNAVVREVSRPELTTTFSDRLVAGCPVSA